MSFAVIGLTVGVVGQLSAAEDAEDAAHSAASRAFANGEHRRQVAEYNASIFTDHATRLRNEQVGRLNEVAGINITRFEEDRTTNVGRIEEALGINTGRFSFAQALDTSRANQDFERVATELNLDAAKDIDQIKEIVGEVVSRLGRKAGDVATTGFEAESDLRMEIAQDVSNQRSFYAAGNIVISTGTPMRMQLDTQQQGEVHAQRIRRDYRIQVRDLKDNASDALRDALFQIEDIQTSANRSVRDLKITKDRKVDDINLTTGWQLEDLHRSAGNDLDDINNTTDLRIEDTSRNLGYDLSDIEFEASQLDQQATLTMLQGDAEFDAGVNRAEAFEQAGDDAFTSGVLAAGGSFIGGVSNIWFSSDSAAVVDSVADVDKT